MPKRKSDAAVEDESAEPMNKTMKAKKGATPRKSAKVLTSGLDHEGNFFWELSSTRKVTISKFKGQTLINVREWYDNGTKPGNKGIHLTLDQYQALVDNVKSINATLRETGIDVKDPADGPAKPLGKKHSAKKKKNDEDDEDEDEDEPREKNGKKKKKDEDEDDAEDDDDDDED